MAACNLTDAQLKSFIVTSLAVADPCSKELLQRGIDRLWTLTSAYGCDKELRYLYTRLNAIKLAMGCYVRQVDTRVSTSTDRVRSQSESRQDGWAQAQATSQSFRISDSCATSRYDDVAKGKMRSGSRRHAESLATASAFGSSRDESKAGSRNYSTDWNVAQTKDGSQSEQFSTGTVTGRESSQGCKYEFSQSAHAGSVVGVNITAAAGVGGLGHVTENTSTWDMEMLDSSAARQDAINTGCSTRNVISNSRARNRSSRDACSFSDSIIDSSSNSTEQADSCDNFQSFRDQFAHADGTGTSKEKAQARSTASSQGSDKAHSDGEGHRRSESNGQMAMDDIKAGQRFQHLRDLYDNTWALIGHKKETLAGGAPVYFGLMLTCEPDGWCPCPGAGQHQRPNYIGVLIQSPAQSACDHSPRACAPGCGPVSNLPARNPAATHGVLSAITAGGCGCA